MYLGGGTTASVRDSIISSNSGPGIYVSSSTATITGNTISNNTGSAISLIGSYGTNISGNIYSGNGVNTVSYGGAIATSMTWTKVGSPYVITETITVNSGVTLTIEPGVIVKGGMTSQQLTINGTLIANGTPEEPIYFTSLRDDSVGGDTNGDGNATSPTYGNWNGIYLAPGSLNNLLNNIVIRYGGYNSYDIYACTSSLTITNSTIENNRYYGIYIVSVHPETGISGRGMG